MPITDNAERQLVAEQLQALIFDLRPDDGPRGQAWVLSTAARFMAHAILATSGQGDTAPVVEIAHLEIARIVAEEVSQAFRNQFRIVPR